MLSKLTILPALIFLLNSCRQPGNHYAIKDFRKPLQPHLTKMVSYGVVTARDSAFKRMVTDNELLQLTQSEHPILRSYAFREIFDRQSFDHFKLLMDHLEDTAEVPTDNGEFGIHIRKVSDDVLLEGYWDSQENKDKTVEAVLTKHNYLRSAYTILLRLEPQGKFYPFIKDMATRPRRLSDGYELDFDDIEYALYGLAKFKKQEDVEIIKDKLMSEVWQLSDVSFGLMKEFPDSAYLEVLEKYHRRRFYKFSGNRPHGFTGYRADRAAPEDFIEALVAQQNERSAKLLDTMLVMLPQRTCMPDRDNILRELIVQIWEHPCPAYAALRKKIRRKAGEILSWRISIPMDPGMPEPDTSKRKFYWYY